ncbi:hypothetical protein AN477_11485 [Alicyclobacillus ferrooxydans]|uniref:Helicase SNF2 n=2 Tax=Alicyclobacillus ferrooxydans TaxID=471514 RepID=A0A0P9CD55_9BACL|nr:hypothetical protein AN477_11485 [Alicyclobacillus ferrooxydans]
MTAARSDESMLSPELQLLVRLVRLAADIVSIHDVVAFAAPRDTCLKDVIAACVEFARQEEEGVGRWTSKGAFAAAWLPAWSLPQHRALRALYISEAECTTIRTTEEASEWVDGFLFLCIDAFVRDNVTVPPVREAEPKSGGGSSYRIMYRGEEEVLTAWQTALSNANKSGTASNIENTEFEADGWLVCRTMKQVFQQTGWSGDWLQDRSGKFDYYLELQLVPPFDGESSWHLRYFVAHRYWNAKRPLSDWWEQPGRDFAIGRAVLKDIDRWVLPKLLEAADVSTAIEDSLQEPKTSEAVIAPEAVFSFLTQEASELEELGFQIRYPDIKEMSAGDIRIRVQVRRKSHKTAHAPSHLRGTSWFDAQQLVEFDWKVALGGTELSEEAFQQLVMQRSPLVQLGGNWRLLPLDTIMRQMETLRRSADEAAGGSFIDVTRMVLLGDTEVQEEIPVDIEFAEDVRDIRDLVYALLQSRRPTGTASPRLFQGRLRDYQKMGYEWLLHLRKIGCGAVLADDMGLGKTIQVLAYWCHLKDDAPRRSPHLLICPTSLLQNWRAEITRFAPTLAIYVHHGGDRESRPGSFTDLISEYDVVMTTYATAVRDEDVLVTVEWDSVVVDEAQNVKNPETKQAKVVSQLNGRHRIALTGTPIENRLEELWSIFRFAIPGYLGSLSWFRRQFIDPISNQESGRTSWQLHQLLQPVLLRRSKTDPNIQLELPEKWEVLEYAGLTSEQGALYQSVVNRLFLSIDGTTTTMSRRGQILTALVRLKQVCDHPCLTVGGSPAVNRSGKLKMLLDLMDDALSVGEAAIVFTQFRSMGEILCDAMEQRFGWRPQFLHGGLTSVTRGEIVDAFQSGRDKSPVLVLSLKAGGVGLNLTRANHVFHYDRWWNPAVEDQATDRVFRIGQTKNVQVHKLVCTGTLEERIDHLIQSKRSLSKAVVGESEGWLTEMDNDALRNLFELDAAFDFEEEEV